MIRLIDPSGLFLLTQAQFNTLISLMNKTKNTIIALIGLALIIGGVLVFNNNEIDNIEWVKYENKELGYSFEYPEGSTIEIEPEEREYKTLNFKQLYRVTTKKGVKDPNSDINKFFKITVGVFENPNSLTLKEWDAELTGRKGESVYKKEFIKIDNRDALKTDASIEGYKFWISIIIIKNDKVLKIEFGEPIIETPHNLDNFNHFVDSIDIF